MGYELEHDNRRYRPYDRSPRLSYLASLYIESERVFIELALASFGRLTNWSLVHWREQRKSGTICQVEKSQSARSTVQ